MAEAGSRKRRLGLGHNEENTVHEGVESVARVSSPSTTHVPDKPGDLKPILLSLCN